MAKAKAAALKKPAPPSAAVLRFAQGRQEHRRKPAADLSRPSNFPPEGSTRLTINLRKDLHTRLKIASARQNETIGLIVEQLIEKHVAKD
jgi:hypothetical protein